MIRKINQNTLKANSNPCINLKKKKRHFKCPDEKLKGPTKELC
jgi:hypothetical protein